MARPKRKKKIIPKKTVKMAKPELILITSKMLSPLGLRQVGVTPKVKKYVAKFKSATRLGRVKKIVADVAKFEKVELPLQKAGKHWANRSAERILETRNVVVAKQPVPDRAPEISGCTDHACAICASIRAIGLPANFVRMGNHSHVKFLYAGKFYIADPTKTSRPIVRAMSVADKRNEVHWKKKGAFAEGKSPANIGLRTVADFYRYSPVKVTQIGRREF
jgi:hypothetical protein